jgi:hypothetical protein
MMQHASSRCLCVDPGGMPLEAGQRLRLLHFVQQLLQDTAAEQNRARSSSYGATTAPS